MQKRPDQGRAYIRGSLTVKGDGPLSDKLRALLHEQTKTTPPERKTEGSSKKATSRSRKNVAGTKRQSTKTTSTSKKKSS